jgi:eukaryotic-like serine/threonine-protein kinase
MVGKTLSHYKILKRLGSGGMGEVYLAQDTKLERTVALKILPAEMSSDPERTRRFIQEAKAASALEHPNVAHIHEISESEGVNFIVMQYVEGQTLDAKIQGKPIDTAEIINIGIQIVDALVESHGKGVIHRDLKPANIMISSRDQVKILDFGLALIRRSVQPDEASELATMAMTESGIVMGTVPYMSPEQAMGKRVDHRTDIYSLGVLLYEMATGRRPFTGNNPMETVERITHSQPEAISRFNYNVPWELERIIRKCLEKSREERYQSATELLVDLKTLKRDLEFGILKSASNLGRASMPDVRTVIRTRRWSNLRTFSLAGLAVTLTLVGVGLYLRMGRSGKIHSLAVLPFVNVNADPQVEYLSDGITESTINSLSQLKQLRVMARTTVFTYKGKQIDPRRVGRDLHVDAIITGSINKQGENLIVQSDLVNTSDGSQIWGHQYTRKVSNILSLQSELANELSESMRIQLTGEEKKRLTKHFTENTQAYQLYLKGRYFWNKRSQDDMKTGLQFFQQAVDIDPGFALAYIGLADSYAMMALYRPIRDEESVQKAKAVAIKAVELDPNLAEAHATLANNAFFFDWDWNTAQTEFQQAIKLNPNYSSAHQWYSLFLISQGRFEESISEMTAAQQLDPLSPIINTEYGDPFLFARRYEEAISKYKSAADIWPDLSLPYASLENAYELKGKYNEAIPAIEKVLLLTGKSKEEVNTFTTSLRKNLQLYGARGFWKTYLTFNRELFEHGEISEYELATILSRLDRKDEAFECLNKAYEAHDWGMVYLKVQPQFDSLRSDRRFSELLRKMGLS